MFHYQYSDISILCVYLAVSTGYSIAVDLKCKLATEFLDTTHCKKRYFKSTEFGCRHIT